MPRTLPQKALPSVEKSGDRYLRTLARTQQYFLFQQHSYKRSHNYSHQMMSSQQESSLSFVRLYILCNNCSVTLFRRNKEGKAPQLWEGVICEIGVLWHLPQVAVDGFVFINYLKTCHGFFVLFERGIIINKKGLR